MMRASTARALCLAAALLALPALALACGWGGPEEVYEVTFFSPELLADPTCAPYFLTPYHRFYDRDPNLPLADLSEANLDEWEGYLGRAIPRATWSELLYKSPLSRVDHLIFRLKGKPAGKADPGDDAFLAYPDRARLIAALYYVGFAKRVEPYALERADYSSWKARDEQIATPARDKAVAALAAGGRKALDAAADEFLHRRYAFQILRLHFYNDDWQDCLSFFDAHRASDFSDGSSVAWRALDLDAGALYKLERYAEANYLFSVIYDRYRPLQLAAAWSFRPQEDEDFRKSLALAKSDRERAVLWHLLGVSADGLRGMREIAAIDPGSDLLPLLLVREVTRVELAANLVEGNTGAEIGSGDTPALLAFVEAAADKGKIAKPWLWDLAAGHLHALAGHADAARRLLDRGEKRAPGREDVRTQARLSRLVAALQAMRAPDPAAEPHLAVELGWAKGVAGPHQDPYSGTPVDPVRARAGALFDWAKVRLAGVYRDHGDLVTAQCLEDTRPERFYFDSANVEKLIRFLARPGKTPFEAFVAGELDPASDDLVEVQALNALYAGDVKEAAALFAKAKDSHLLADPFEMHIRDNHDRDADRPGHTVYSKRAFVDRLAKLLAEAEADPTHAAELFLELGNAWYNISYYGNSRAMYETVGEHFVAEPWKHDCSRARSYYERAAELATSRELRAKAAFMASKCEQNAYYATDGHKGDFIAAGWYDVLRDELADTKYYQEILAECGYFATYVGQHPGKHAR